MPAKRVIIKKALHGDTEITRMCFFNHVTVNNVLLKNQEYFKTLLSIVKITHIIGY
ncbi:hypothetical protein Mpal_1936 [Methanosphaerula palustris E1-9c]|uniref:Uncharacterized protein n=1 Tax=Methanosphaerula palustris (strain ATCC BAA-1556 / DSM 19958 / E1-9c) TaxID=521011 RepID=B8GKU4_METPE|nr:hypothetical protein Mpal_1936 [Methanosphaerula palustris E1-9c]